MVRAGWLCAVAGLGCRRAARGGLLRSSRRQLLAASALSLQKLLARCKSFWFEYCGNTGACRSALQVMLAVSANAARFFLEQQAASILQR